MAEQTQKNKRLGPNHRKIYEDLIRYKFPEQWDELKPLLEREQLDYFAVNRLNKRLFGDKSKEQLAQSQKYKSYDKATILKILDYQKKHQLNNTEVAQYFKLSRNTVAKWLKLFGEEV